MAMCRSPAPSVTSQLLGRLRCRLTMRTWTWLGRCTCTLYCTPSNSSAMNLPTKAEAVAGPVIAPVGTAIPARVSRSADVVLYLNPSMNKPICVA
eukprot:365738-Chlamydomonas_euryale.AAC.10